jgi:hypothetical protein
MSTGNRGHPDVNHSGIADFGFSIAIVFAIKNFQSTRPIAIKIFYLTLVLKIFSRIWPEKVKWILYESVVVCSLNGVLGCDHHSLLKNISQSIYRTAQNFLSHDRTPS